MSSCSTKLFILALTSTSDKTPSGFIAFKDIKIISVFLSYSAGAPSVCFGSKIMLPCASVFLKVVVDNSSSLTMTPVSFKPILSKSFFDSCANLFTRPCSTASRKFIICSSKGFGGIKPS